MSRDNILLEVRKCKEGRGLFATQDIKKGETVLSIPEMDLIDERKCERDLGKNLSEALSIDEKYYVWLAMGKQAGASYTNSIPTVEEVEKISLDFASQREIEILQSTVRRSQLDNRRLEINTAYHRLLEKFETKPEIQKILTPPVYLWARFILDSRAFSWKESYVLIPFADMLNHHSTRGIQNFGREGNKMVFKSHVNVCKGEQVYLCYNTWMPSWGYATNYGFVPEDLDQTNDTFPLETCFGNDVSGGVKKMLSEGNEIGPGYATGTGFISKGLLTRLRVQALSRDFSELSDVLKGWTPSLPTELAAYTSLRGLLITLLEHYTTTINGDLASLERELPPFVRTFLSLRVRDKKTLAASLGKVSSYQKELAGCVYNGGTVPIDSKGCGEEDGEDKCKGMQGIVQKLHAAVICNTP